MSTTGVTLWTPLRKKHRSARSPRNPAAWARDRGLPAVDRLNIHFDTAVGFDPGARMPWSDLTLEQYRRHAERYDRRQVYCFTELEPGLDAPTRPDKPERGYPRGGVGYQGNIPRMDWRWFRTQVRRFKAWGGDFLARTHKTQAGNEVEVCSAVRSAGRYLEWFAHLVECIKVLRDELGVDVATGGLSLRQTRHGAEQFNWWLAERNGFGDGVVADHHWNGMSVQAVRLDLEAFRARFPDVRWTCLENSARQDSPTFARLAVELGAEEYGDFFGWFGAEEWGLRSPFRSTSRLAITGVRDGKLRWNRPNARAARKAAAALSP